MLLFSNILLAVAIILIRKSIASMDSFFFDVNDILNENLMPAALFREPDNVFAKGSNVTRKEFFNSTAKVNNFTSAYSTMDYHRKMMNEYQATNFLAKQVFEELVEPTSTRHMQRRIGVVPDVEMPQAKMSMMPNEEMLYDPGSSGYKNWLEKTTTLDDIQRQMTESANLAQNKSLLRKRKRPLVASRRQSSYSDDEDDYEYDEGDVTGFAYHRAPVNHAPASMADYSNPFAAATNQKYDAIIPTAGNKNGYNYQPSGHESYEEYGPHNMQTQSKELGFKDIMDIALTTLAFLGFGTFILQVLMCITMNKDDGSNLMMLPLESDPEAADTEEIRRRKRSLHESLKMQKMNELSRRVLLSIESVMKIPKDDGQCHYKLLCDNNKFATEQKDGQKIWIPIWSLGMSWLSSRFASPETQTNPILSSLKASVIGLGGGNCREFYGSCDLHKDRDI